MSSHVENFRDAIRAAGMMPPDAIEPGRIYRFPGVGKANGNGAGWCNLFPDGMGGSFGDWSTGLSENWQARRERPISLAEREAFREQVARAQAESEAERKRTQAEAATQAAERWQQGEPAPVDHPYLVRKGIQPNGARVLGATLLVPMRDGSGALCNVQRIPPEGGGKKLFQFGARVNGCYFAIGKTNGVIHIAEGFATGASVHEATGEAVAVAFSAGNLDAVARTLRTKYPQARIVMCADDDYQTAANTGLTKATEAALAVGGLVAKPDFGIVRPDGAKDFNDLHQLHGAEAVRGAIASAAAPKLSQIQPAAPSATAGDLDDRVWPDALDNAALHGIAGEFVRMVEPNTEADPAAILLQFLAAFGALVGRGPHYLVEGDEHHANLYVLLVGATAKGRKGTSWGRVRQIFERMTDWKPHASGLSSGEGITQESPSWATGSGPIHRAIKPTNCRLSNRLLSKYHVRDACEETKTNKNGELVTSTTDEGVTDKRLFVAESEFAGVLRAVQRPGNTLSATIREGWDSGNLRSLTKNDPITATGAHICIVGHVTDDELRAELTATDTANGFANRFLFVAVKRSKLLPHGGERADDGEAQAFADRLREYAAAARTRHRIKMTSEASAIWEEVYPLLSAGSGGLHGAVTARAEAQTIRLSLLYCLLDGADQIDTQHLIAALAVWQYCDATARYVFGASLGDRIADDLMRRLEQAGDVGLTRTDIRDAFKRHQSAEKISAALDMLRTKGRAKCETVNTGGRPVELWRVNK